jgi:hypothetical protein
MKLNLIKLAFLTSSIVCNAVADINALCQASCPGVKKSESCTKTCMQTGGYGNPPPDANAMKACGDDYHCWTKVSRRWLGYSEEQANYLMDFDKIVEVCQDRLDRMVPKCVKDCEAQELPVYRKCISELTQTSETSWNDIYSCENKCMGGKGNFNEVRECSFNCNLGMYKSLKTAAAANEKQSQSSSSSSSRTSGAVSINTQPIKQISLLMGLLVTALVWMF